MELPDENSKRFVAVLNKKIEIGKLLNALGHMTAGLTGGYDMSSDMCFLNYKDASGGSHPYVSHYPFIVLTADNSNQIRTLRNIALSNKIIYTDFTSTMTLGTSAEQMRATAQTPEEQLEYYGITLFGETQLLKSCTKKFSLFRL